MLFNSDDKGATHAAIICSETKGAHFSITCFKTTFILVSKCWQPPPWDVYLQKKKSLKHLSSTAHHLYIPKSTVNTIKCLFFLIIQKIDMGTFVSEVKILMTQNEEQKTLSSIIINYYFHGLISKRIILPLIPLRHITILLSHSLRENSKASFPTSKWCSYTISFIGVLFINIYLQSNKWHFKFKFHLWLSLLGAIKICFGCSAWCFSF